MHSNFYQHIYFTIGRQLDYLFGEDKDIPPVWFTSYNPYDRCINTYQISYKLNELAELVPNIIGTFKVPANAVFLEKFFQCYADDRTLSPSVDIVKKMIQSDKPDADEFLYHLILLYHHFPRHPNLFIDGVVKNLLLNVARQGDTPVYGTINLLWNHPKLGYNTYPWLQIALFNRDGNPIAINPERKHHWVLIDQENLDSKRILSDWPSKKLSPSTKVNDYLQEYNVIYDYLDPLFLKYEMSNGGPFTGESFYSEVKGEQQATQVEHLLLLPVYDFENNSKIIGNITGNCLIPFVRHAEGENRQQFIEASLDRVRNKVSTIPKMLRDARTEYVTSSEIWDVEDPLNEFLSKVPYIQDWECLYIIDQNKECLVGCYSKPKGCDQGDGFDSQHHITPNHYKKFTEACVPEGDNCKNCDHSVVVSNLNQIASLGEKSGVFSLNVDGGLGTLFYFIRLKHWFNSKVLSFFDTIEPRLVDRYHNYIILFQFPSYTLFNVAKNEQVYTQAKKLGDLYAGEIIPFFDKILLKLKVGQMASIQESNQLLATMLHELKSSLRHALFKPTQSAIKSIKNEQIKEGLQKLTIARKFMANYINNLSFIVKGFRAIFEHQYPKIAVNKDLIKKWQNDRLIELDRLFLKGIYPSSQIDFEITGEPLILSIASSTLELLIHIIVNNGVDAMDFAQVPLEGSGDFKITFKRFKEADRDWGLVSIWNRGTQFDEHTMRNAGPRTLSGGLSEGHTGLGFFGLEIMLKNARAKACNFNRHFELMNTSEPKGASVQFYLPLIQGEE
jgi:hypothetical protein